MITNGLMIKINRATQTAQQQIVYSIVVDETMEKTSGLSLKAAESIGVNKSLTTTAVAASEILQRTTIINDTITAISSSMASTDARPVISTHEVSDTSTTPIVLPTPIILSLFDISKIKGGG
jgi:hypothetical protein